MAKRNAYLARQDAIKQKCFEVACETTTQQFFDYMCIVLNDPKIMGKDAFGAMRLKRLQEAILKFDKEFSEAWCGSDMSDYYQELIDGKLKEIFGEIVPFRERYPYLKEYDYSKPSKK